MSLHSVAVDWRTVLFDGIDKIYSDISLPLERIVVVVNEDRLGPALASHLEGRSDEIVVAIVVTA